jgi:hypothetical protein
MMKTALTFFLYFSLSLCLVSPGYTAERDITLQWDESIDAPSLQSYKIYYYTTSGDAGSLNAADYAVSYTLAGESPVLINPLSDPKPITINKSNTQVTLHFSAASKIYCFAVTAVDTKGLESLPTNEVISEIGSEGSATSAGSGGAGSSGAADSSSGAGSGGAGSGGGGNGSGGGGCFIATAAFGSYLDPHVNVLRSFRDRYLLTNSLGQAFVNYYYRYSPPMADVIRKHESLKSATRWALVPVVYGIEYPYLMAVLLIIPAGIGLAYRRRKTQQSH